LSYIPLSGRLFSGRIRHLKVYQINVFVSRQVKENEIYTKYYYFEYKTDGTYKVKFNNYKQEIEVNVNIKK